jgi:uncharacterized protein YgiB involved in biofilm formation
MMKRSQTTSLLLMGAAPLLFSACTKEPEVQEGLYTSVESCYQATGDQAACKSAFNKAQQASADQAPRYASRAECEQEYSAERCVEQRTSQGHSFIGPMMAGFFMSQMLNNRGAGLTSAPAFQNRGNGWVKPDTSKAFGGATAFTGNRAMTPVTSEPNRAVTASRGGFGSRSSGRSSFGG